MKSRIQILYVEEKKGTAKKSGQPYEMVVCQAAVHQEGGKVEAGELVLPKDHPKIVPGLYDAEFGVSVGPDKRITGRLVQLTPVGASARAVA